MKKIWLLPAVCALLSCAGGVRAPDGAIADDRQEVLHVLQARLDAVVAGDVGALDALLAPEFRYIDVWGRVQQRAPYLESKRTSMNTETDHWIGQSIEDAEITFVDSDIVLATLRVRDHFVYQGVEHVNPVRSTYVLTRAQGRWLFALGHTTSIDPDAE